MRSALLCLALCLSGAAVAADQAGRGDPAKGKVIAGQICVACHAQDGNSPLAANPRLAGQIPEYLHKQIRNFKGAEGRKAERESAVMGAMVTTLSEADMLNVAAWYASQKPAANTSKNKDTLVLGQRLYRGGDSSKGLPACSACHGANGGGVPSQYPRLAGQFAEYSEAQLKAFRDGARGNDASRMMRMIAARMTDQEIRAVSDYMAGLR